MKKNKFKLWLFRILGFLFLIAPIIAVFIYNRDIYFATAEDSFNITVGALIGLAVAIIIIVGKSDILKGYAGLIVGLLIIYFLNSIIKDLLLIYSSIVVGDTIYRFIFTPLIKKYTEICKYQSEQYVKEAAKKQYELDLAKKEEKRKRRLGSV